MPSIETSGPDRVVGEPDIHDNAATDETKASAKIDPPVSDSGAYPPACRECGDFDLCVHDVGEEG